MKISDNVLKSLLNICAVFIIVGIASHMIFAEPAYATQKPLKGKNVLIDGDSIQCGFGKYIETSIITMGAKTVKNISTNGATLAQSPKTSIKKNSTYYRIARMSAKEMRKYNYIIIASGTNDYFRFGKIKPGSIYSDNIHTTCGALNKIIRVIHKRSPKTKIAVVTPIHRFSGGRNCDTKKNLYKKTLSDYREAIMKVAEKYDYVYIINGTDLTKSKEMSKYKYSRDGLHPTRAYARKVLTKRFKEKFKNTVLNVN